MKKEHKTMLVTLLLTLLVIAIINNVSTLSALKELVYGKSSWF